MSEWLRCAFDGHISLGSSRVTRNWHAPLFCESSVDRIHRTRIGNPPS